MSDPDGSGEIDFEEFKVAMFAVDPDSGNPVGFTPSALLSPLDAFEVSQRGREWETLIATLLISWPSFRDVVHFQVDRVDHLACICPPPNAPQPIILSHSANDSSATLNPTPAPPENDNTKMFDEDNSGKIDEDEFFFLLQYLGIEVSGWRRLSLCLFGVSTMVC